MFLFFHYLHLPPTGGGGGALRLDGGGGGARTLGELAPTEREGLGGGAGGPPLSFTNSFMKSSFS